MDRLREIESTILKEYSNLYKNRQRPRTLSGVLTKKTQLKEFLEEYKLRLKSLEFKIRTSEWNEEVEKYTVVKEYYDKSITILNNTKTTEREYNSDSESGKISRPLPKPIASTSTARKRVSNINLIKRKFKLKILAKIFIWCITKPKMALDIRTASELATLIPAYDGNTAGAKSFIDAVNLAETIVPEDKKLAAIQIILTKLSGKARNLFVETPENYDTIINKIKTNCSEKLNTDQALDNLKNLKLKGDIQSFTKQLDLLSTKLTETYINRRVPSDVATSLSHRVAVQTIIDNSSNNETKMMLSMMTKMGQLHSLQDAINIMHENEKPQASVANVLQTMRSNNNFRNNSNSGICGRNYQTQQHSNYRFNSPRRLPNTTPRYPNNRNLNRNYNSSYNNNFNNRTFNHQFRPNFSNNGNFQQNFNNHNRNFNGNRNFTVPARRMYIAQQEFPAMPQNAQATNHNGNNNQLALPPPEIHNNVMNHNHFLANQ